MLFGVEDIDENNFNPRPPHRGRRIVLFGAAPGNRISTHAPRTGGDARMFPPVPRASNFNPRPPHRGRRWVSIYKRRVVQFQPTPPAQGATSLKSISLITTFVFQPTPPAQGATQGGPDPGRGPEVGFQPTPPAQGATEQITTVAIERIGFQPTPPAQGATY